MKIGINGGSFNPVHNGHIKLCREFLSLVPLDRIFMIPVSFPPHKQVSFLASGEDRMNMLRLALEDEKNIEPCGMELRRGGKSYTVDTVNAFEKIYPDGEFFLIMGADMFLTLEEWKDAGTLIEKCGICTAARDDAEVEGLLEHAEKIGVSRERLYVSDMEKMDVSSTMIRRLAAERKSLRGYVPESVERYIYSNNLYCQEGWEDRDPSRVNE